MTDSPTTTPQDERAESRARHRVRARRWAWRGAIGTAVVLVLAAILAVFLLETIAGRKLLLQQIVNRLPTGTTLVWARAEGPASGPLTLHDVRFTTRRQRDPDCVPTRTASCAMGTIVFTAQRIVIDPALRPLLGRRLRLDAMQVTAATLDLPSSDEPFKLPQWPEVLPDIAPPLSLQADDMRVDGLRITRDGAPMIDIRRLRGGMDVRTGELKLAQVVIDSDRGRFTANGHYAPRKDYAMDMVATAVLPARIGRTPPRLGLVAKGDLSRMQIAVAGAAPAPLRATLILRAPRSALPGGTSEAQADRSRWTLTARADALDLALLSDPKATPTDTPLMLRLQASGVGGTVNLRGTLRQGDLDVVVQPSTLRLADQVLDVQRLVIDTYGGRVTARGRADLRHDTRGTVKFAVNARGLRMPATTPTNASRTASTPASPIVADADLGIAGTVGAWAAIGNARITRGTQRAAVKLDGRGNREGMDVRALTATTPSGTLTARGDVRWAPSLGWALDATLAGFDPGYFAPGWDGAIRGAFTTRGTTRDNGAIEIAINAPRIGGSLRNRPLSGNGRATILTAPTAAPDTPLSIAGDVDLTIGASKLVARGRIDDTLDIDARFSPFQIADLLPDSRGALDGTLRLTGARNAPDIDVDLRGRDVRYGDYVAESFDAQGRLPWRAGRAGALRIDASGVRAGLALDTVEIDARGAIEDLALDVRTRGPMGAIDLTGNARRSGATWSGTLASASLAPERGAPWRLQQPASFRWDGRNGTLSNACLSSGAGGSLCANADWPRRGLDVDANDLPLAMIVPYLPAKPPGGGRQWLLRGAVDIDAQVRPVGAAWRGTAKVTSATGGLRFSPRARREVVRYSNLQLDATFDPRGIDARLQSTVMEDGRLAARVATGWDAYAPLDGELVFDTDELTWMELFSPDIVEPTGRLDGRITLAGTRAQPRLGGQAKLAGFSTEMPALGITVRDGSATLVAQADGSARIDGRLRSGDGTLAINGTLGFGASRDVPLLLNLRGTNVLVSDTRDLRAVVSPDVQVRVAVGQPISVTGRVDVPSAQIDLERLDQGVSASPDVVVLDPVNPDIEAPSTIDMDLLFALGDDVQLDGFGLDGQLGGSLRVRARPGREMRATGTLDVDGRYSAYGQRLDITRGQMSWSNDVIGDPILNVRAERVVGGVTAGVAVTGRASAPRADVYSSDGASQSEALSYLALGRPISGLSGSERSQLNAANAALSAGGSLLASQLGARIGLDDAGISESRALGGSVLGIGKYLSPRLYVGVGVSLLGTGQVLTLKYLLRKGFDIELETSSVESRGSVNYRKER